MAIALGKAGATVLPLDANSCVRTRLSTVLMLQTPLSSAGNATKPLGRPYQQNASKRLVRVDYGVAILSPCSV
jgi:hypothetical protein